MRVLRVPVLCSILAAVLLTSVPAGIAPSAAAGTAPEHHVSYADWSNRAELSRGVHQGTWVRRGALGLHRPVGTRWYRDPHTDRPARRYEYARWRSPWKRTRFGLTELVASWNASTPGHSWVEIEMRGTTETGQRSTWYVLGRWAAGGRALRRTSADSQSDGIGAVATDTFRTAGGHRLRNWQLRVTLLRPVGGAAQPRVRSVGAMASRVSVDAVDTASRRRSAGRTVLPVPTYSQQKHAGRYEQWGGGGEAWCSPTSTAMVLRYWGSGPKPAEYRWVRPKDDPWVVHAARGSYDYRYDGAGNWPFNTAYAGRYGMHAFVTRLRSLTEAERFIDAGIPLVVSVSFDRDDLPQAGYSTAGHLLVIVGFDRRGNVVVNDPASHLEPRNDQVRVHYNRKNFENAWLPHSGGLTYVIHPRSVPLPPAPRQANW
ncbi:MAG TPA: peptidase C39 family protein [Nocardioidaceae bacterium]|nr:peptidase C39 family protein [Nocardioidaceae bacterium]